jgi:predicted SprT family Zn-dependent metalloprotease
MMNINDMKILCETACRKYNIPFTLPIVINKRFTRTLGQVTFEQQASNFVPIKFEISEALIDNCTDQQVKDVVLHECAHYIAAVVSNQNHGHDAYFKRICHTIGTTNDTATTKDTDLTERLTKLDKYTVYCPRCGAIGGYQRMCSTLRYIKSCYCKKCKGYGLYYAENR